MLICALNPYLEGAAMSEYQPPSSILPLPESLALLDRVFGANTILNDRGKDQVRAYYKQPLIGYEK